MPNFETATTAPAAGSPSSAAPPAAAEAVPGHRFYFEGGKLPCKVFGCMTCVAATAKSCVANPPHVQPTDGCQFCATAKSGMCSSHGRGVLDALDAHEKGLMPGARKAFAPYRAFVEAEVAQMPDDAKVRVSINAYAGLPECHPRLASIEVLQLKG